jgi:cobalamin synthase
MWQQYRKTFIPIQLLMVTLVLLLFFYFKANIPTILAVIVTMEFASVLGAMWALRLRRRIDAKRGDLPLRR